MSMSHGGHAGHMPASGDRKALVISGWLTGLYFIVELGIGIWTGSVAVMSDAFHTFSAVGGVLIALVAMRLSERKSSPARTFGYIRAEILGALFNGLFLVGMAIFVLWMGAMRLMEPIELATTPMLIAAAGGIATELVALWLLYERQKDNLNMRGAYWHILQTFVGSFLIIISALVIRFTGFLAVDPLLGMAFGLVLLWASLGHPARVAAHPAARHAGGPGSRGCDRGHSGDGGRDGRASRPCLEPDVRAQRVLEPRLRSRLAGWRAGAEGGEQPPARPVQGLLLDHADRGILPCR